VFEIEVSAHGWQVRNKATGLLAAVRIPTYEQAVYQVAYFANKRTRAGVKEGFPTWHSKQRSKGPTTVQRPMKCKRPPMTSEAPRR